MGPFDNATDLHLFDAAIMAAHWLIHDESGALYIVAREQDDFEGYGPDDDTLASLFALDEETLSDDASMEAQGFSLVYPPLRRFSEEAGYYSA